MSSPNILVIDDDPAMSEILVDLAVGEGFQAVAVGGIVEAKAQMESISPDLIISDLSLPDGNGLDLIRDLVKQGTEASFLVITGVHDMQLSVEALNLGVSGFLVKPFSLADAAKRINEIMQKKSEESKQTRLFEFLKRDRIKLNDDLQFALEKAQSQTISGFRSLALALDARDPYTHQHSKNVAELATELARALGWKENRVKIVRLAGELHDIGKIGIPDEILVKRAKLTDAEYTIMKNHPEIGARIISPLADMPELIEAVRHHHERFDGKGYADQLTAKGIPEMARVLSVCDAWDAMTSDRPYRSGMPHATAAGILRKEANSQFDGRLVEVFLGNHIQDAVSLSA